jgi:ATP diphosphatase
MANQSPVNAGAAYATNGLLDMMARLRAPERGCSTDDLEQNFATIARYAIEEADEVAETIEHQDMPALMDKLGDLPLQAVFHAQMEIR